MIANVSSSVAETARTDPFKKALVCPAARDRNGRLAYTHFTYRQLDQESDCIAAGLANTGIGHGTRTMLALPPGLAFYALAIALFKIGAVPVIMDPKMGITAMLRRTKDTRPEAFVGLPGTRMLQLLRPDCFRNLKAFIVIGRRLLWGGLTMKDIRKVPWVPAEVAKTKTDDPAAVIFTPGNAGPAKGVVHTHGSLISRANLLQEEFAIGSDEIDLVTYPGNAFFGLILGLTAIIPDMDPERPGDTAPENIIEPIIDQGVTNLSASPSLLDQIGQFGRNNRVSLPSLRRILSMGAPLPPSHMERFSKILSPDVEIHSLYGSEEAMPVMSVGSREVLSETGALSEKGYGSCIGRPVSRTEVRLITITDTPIESFADDMSPPQGEIGELIVRGDTVAANYLDNPDLDAINTITDHGEIWHRTGDLGWMDKNNRFWFCGRKSHCVLTDQGPLYPIPCEAIFNSHPDVCRCALVGIGPVENRTPVLCVELEETEALDKQRIQTELTELADHSIITRDIKTILFHKQLPVDTRHRSKIIREELAAWAEKQLK